MDESLEENTICHVQNFGITVKVPFHANLVAHLALLINLVTQNFGEVDSGKSSRLHNEHFAFQVGLPDVLIQDSRNLSRLPASRLPSN